MKRKFIIPYICIASLFGTSCTALLPRVQQTAANSSSKPEFIDGITLAKNSNEGSINQKKQTYRVPIFDFTDDDCIDEETVDVKGRDYLMYVNNTRLRNFINQWYGVPYRLGGTTMFGIDCSSFVQTLYGQVYEKYLLRTAREQFDFCSTTFNLDVLKEGDLVFFTINRRNISHVGVYLGNGKFVHASTSRGVMISDITDKYWTKYYAGGGQLKDKEWAREKN